MMGGRLTGLRRDCRDLELLSLGWGLAGRVFLVGRGMGAALTADPSISLKNCEQGLGCGTKAESNAAPEQG